jgi:hypothetical protein
MEACAASFQGWKTGLKTSRAVAGGRNTKLSVERPGWRRPTPLKGIRWALQVLSKLAAKDNGYPKNACVFEELYHNSLL